MHEIHKGGVLVEDQPAILAGEFKQLITATGRFMETLTHQVKAEPQHTCIEGLYRREFTMPKDTIWVSRVHKHDNFAFIISGECSVLCEDGAVRLKAPCVLTTLAGTQRMLQIHETCTWVTVHAIPPELAGDVDAIEDYLACNTLEEYEQCLLQQAKKLEVTA